MIVTTQGSVTISPEAIGEALAISDPEEFKTVWDYFTEVEGSHLDLLAKRMATTCGGARKEPLKKLVKLIEFHEHMAELSDRRDYCEKD